MQVVSLDSCAMGDTQNLRGPKREPKLWEHQRGHGWFRKGLRTHTPCGRAVGGPRIATVPFDLPFGSAGDPRKSGPPGRLLTASSPAPMCRQHCGTERVRKIQWEGICSQRAARAPSESIVRLAVRVDNIATRPGGSTVQVLTDYVCCSARLIHPWLWERRVSTSLAL